MSVLDRGGRIADRAVIEALGWTPGTHLHLDAARTHLTLRAANSGALTVKHHRYLWLPATTRHLLSLIQRRPKHAGPCRRAAPSAPE